MDRIPNITALLLLGLTLFPALASAQSAETEAPVEDAAREALADFPWYDADKGELKRLDVEPPGDLANRDSKWLFTPPQWKFPKWLGTVFKVLAWTLLIMLIVVLAFMLARTFMDLDVGLPDRYKAGEDVSLSGDVDRVDALPFQLKRPQGDLLSEAQRLYDEGKYAEAMIYLYSYQLVQLDKSHVIRLTRGKTNRQYMREIRRRSNLIELMQHSMVTFEDVFFGNHPLGRSSFESCWSRLEEFHQQLSPEHALA